MRMSRTVLRVALGEIPEVYSLQRCRSGISVGEATRVLIRRRVALAGRRGRHRLGLDRIASDSHRHRKAKLILPSGMPGAE
jgi:hypothetical protein